jgi:hypothetical protein
MPSRVLSGTFVQAVEGWVGNIKGGVVDMILTVLVGVIKKMTSK